MTVQIPSQTAANDITTAAAAAAAATSFSDPLQGMTFSIYVASLVSEIT